MTLADVTSLDEAPGKALLEIHSEVRPRAEQTSKDAHNGRNIYFLRRAFYIFE